jgi:hypothetical protein
VPDPISNKIVRKRKVCGKGAGRRGQLEIVNIRYNPKGLAILNDRLDTKPIIRAANNSMEISAPSSGIARMTAVGSIIAIMMTTTWRTFGGPDALFVVVIIAEALLIGSEYRNIPVKMRHTALMLFATSIALLPFARSPLEAVQRGIFVSGLLIALMSSVMLLARCALRSRQVHAVGTNLRGQRPGRRYLSFTLASQIFSAMLGLAGANIMLVMAAPPNEGKSAGRTTAIIAVTRGFTAASLWSPVLGNMAILLALYPTLHWIEVFPVGVALAQVTLFVGMLMNHSSRKPIEPAPDFPEKAGLAAAIPILGAMLGYLCVILAASSALKISISTSIVLLGPVAALVMNVAMAGPDRRFIEGLRGMRESMLQLPALASEAIMFTAAGCAGSIMADAFPAEWVRHIGQLLGGLPFFGIGFLMLSIMAIAFAGVHPVLSAVFMASSITPQVLGLPPVVHIAAILAGWAMSASVTPYSVLSLTASRYSGTTLYQISIGKNWAFALANTVLTCGMLTLVALAMR